MDLKKKLQDIDNKLNDRLNELRKEYLSEMGKLDEIAKETSAKYDNLEAEARKSALEEHLKCIDEANDLLQDLSNYDDVVNENPKLDIYNQLKGVTVDELRKSHLKARCVEIADIIGVSSKGSETAIAQRIVDWVKEKQESGEFDK